MNAERHVKLFRNGRNQAVRIPREFELPGEDAIMRQEDGRLILESTQKRKDLSGLVDWLRAQPPLGPDDRFPDIEDPPAEPVDLFGDGDA